MPRNELREYIGRGYRCVRFLRCTSIGFSTIERRSRVYLTENWQERYLRGLGYSVLSLALGPWGVPWGLWLTARSVWINLTGGEDVTEEILTSRDPVPKSGSGR
jgi:hypothetical protein